MPQNMHSNSIQCVDVSNRLICDMAVSMATTMALVDYGARH